MTQQILRVARQMEMEGSGLGGGGGGSGWMCSKN